MFLQLTGMLSHYLEYSPSVIWSPIFAHPTLLEDDSVYHLFAMLDIVASKAFSLDIVRWSLISTGKFTVQTYFLHLSSSLGN